MFAELGLTPPPSEDDDEPVTCLSSESEVDDGLDKPKPAFDQLRFKDMFDSQLCKLVRHYDSGELEVATMQPDSGFTRVFFLDGTSVLTECPERSYNTKPASACKNQLRAL